MPTNAQPSSPSRTMGWKSALGLIGVLLVIRRLIAPWFWLIAAAIGFIWAWSSLQARFTGHRHLINVGMVILAIVTVGPYVYSIVEPYNVRTADAGKRRLLFWDLWRSEAIDPPMLKSRNELSDQLQWLEDQAGMRHSRALAQIRADLNSGRITLDEAWKRTRAIQDEIGKFQAETKKLSWSSPRPAVAGTATSQSQIAPRTIEVQLDPVKWSGWINITHKTICHSPGWQEFWFDTGEKIRLDVNGSITKTLPNGATSKLSQFPDPMPSARFRLRGTAGIAKLEL